MSEPVMEPWTAGVLDLEPSTLRQVVKHSPPTSYGDCFRTCVACLIGASDPRHVPHFVAQSIEAAGGQLDPAEGAWEDLAAARTWLRAEHELDLFPMTRSDADEMGVHYKATVISPTGVHHSVIGRAGQVVWCPAGYDVAKLDMLPGESVWVVARPWLPDPEGMVAEWRQRRLEGAA